MLTLLITRTVIDFVYAAAPTRPPARNCTQDEFRCDDGTCIERRYRCDREYHCPDGTDEFDCCKSAVYCVITHICFTVYEVFCFMYIVQSVMIVHTDNETACWS